MTMNIIILMRIKQIKNNRNNRFDVNVKKRIKVIIIMIILMRIIIIMNRKNIVILK